MEKTMDASLKWRKKRQRKDMHHSDVENSYFIHNPSDSGVYMKLTTDKHPNQKKSCNGIHYSDCASNANTSDDKLNSSTDTRIKKQKRNDITVSVHNHDSDSTYNAHISDNEPSLSTVMRKGSKKRKRNSTTACVDNRDSDDIYNSSIKMRNKKKYIPFNERKHENYVGNRNNLHKRKYEEELNKDVSVNMSNEQIKTEFIPIDKLNGESSYGNISTVNIKEESCNTSIEDNIGTSRKNKSKGKKKFKNDNSKLRIQEETESEKSYANDSQAKCSSMFKDLCTSSSYENSDSESGDTTLAEETLNLSHIDADNLKDLEITLAFPVHPLHSFISRASKPKKIDVEAITDAGLEIKKGIFTAAEDNIIRDNWERFCKEHNLTVAPSNFFTFPSKMKCNERLKFLQYLSHDLPNRLLHSVHKRFMKLYKESQYKEGRFKEEEDQIILEYIVNKQSTSKRPIKDLMERLDRDHDSIERRYRRLMVAKEKLNWDLELVSKFVNCMIRVCKVHDVKQLEDLTLTETQWQKLSRKMKLPVAKLQKAWKLTIYPRFFCDDNPDIVRMKLSIIEILYDTKESDWRTVNWKEIASNFNGFTPLKVYMLFRLTVSSHVPKKHHKNLRECVLFLKRKISTDTNLRAKLFRKYKYCDGHVEYA